jgi:hypothetical protein
VDVARDGIALYQSDESELHTPKPKTAQQTLDMATEYFEEWFSAAVSSQKIFHFCLSQNENRDAAFNLHQARERLYHCVLLVTTFYTPHVHNLAFLPTQAERQFNHLGRIEASPHSVTVSRMNMRGQFLECNFTTPGYAPQRETLLVHREVVIVDIPSPQRHSCYRNRKLEMLWLPFMSRWQIHVHRCDVQRVEKILCDLIELAPVARLNVRSA